MTRCLVAIVAGLAVVGCGDEAAAPRPARPEPPRREAVKPPRVKPLRCPSGTANCRAAIGRVIYVEAVDPDGDGDLHVVLASEQEITGPGITVVDVERDLRPRHVPRLGDTVAAEGPVYRGSYGQRQIEADRVRFSRR